ncbi:hypothetical protein BJY04DRAFT_178511 [Aspergillus karnatakaensis]|uniref:transcription factor xanC n=1 Tax=Aspergillus karnatakaensis TaxID=1810916 RepID=UPI003CCE3F42
MPAKHHAPEPVGSPKQDPTERRRLQNRLSQRNHRRKIRDRIAKLQERVIASELRAAATLHGWHSAPCIPYEVKPSPSSTSSSSLSLSPPATSSPPTELQCPPPTPYGVSLNTIPQLPTMISTAGYDDSSSGLGSLGSTPGGSGTSSPTSLVAPDGLSGASVSNALLGPGAGLVPGQGFGLDTMAICEQWGFQGSVYLATESSLPQILQTLGPTSNAIIVLPSSGYSSGYTQGQMDMNSVCQCHCQGLGWMGCPLHSMG